MPLVSLSINRFRNLEPVSLQLSAHLNLFIGANAAGKTSLLEALYVLARARSFRARSLDKVIQKGDSGFQIVAKLRDENEREIPVGMSREEKKLLTRIDGVTIKRLSELAALFPIQWLGGNLHRLIEEGPAFRRQFLDWGLFHVKPAYMPTWKRFQKQLRQRNAALRAKASAKEVQAWDKELAETGEQLHQYRDAYVKALSNTVGDISRELLSRHGEAEIRYKKGWPADSTFRESLINGLDQDREQGFTRVGPQRAELIFHCDKKPVSEYLSRGQQKLFVIALQIAQARLLRCESGRTSIFLMDDLGAELDKANQARVMRLLQTIESQVFVTAIDEPDHSGWNIDTVSRFHVKHGVVSKVV